MSSTERLVMRSVPRAGESLLGFLLRLSEANHCAGVAALVGLTNLPRTFQTRPCALRGLVSILGGTVSSGELEERSYWRAAPRSGIRFVGATVSTVDINLIHPKVCPNCLEESGIARQVWDLRVMTVCWRHGIYLVDQCSECGTRLGWRRKRLLHCDCGSLLTKQSADTAPAAAIAFALELEMLLINGNSWVDPFPMPIRSLGSVCKAIWWFGAELAGLKNAQPIAIAKPRICVGAKVVSRGIYFLENWPRSIKELFKEPKSSASTVDERRSEQVLYRMRHAFNGSDFDRLFDDVREHLRLEGYPVKRNSFYAVDAARRGSHLTSRFQGD